MLFVHGHTDSKSVLHHVSFWSGRSEMDVYNQFAKFFIQWSLLVLPQMFLSECRMPLLLFNLSRNREKCKIKRKKKDSFLSKVPLGEGSAAMGFQICFKSVGFSRSVKIKRRSRAVKVTHPPADRRQLHGQRSWPLHKWNEASAKCNDFTSKACWNLWRCEEKLRFLSEELLRLPLMRQDAKGVKWSLAASFHHWKK